SGGYRGGGSTRNDNVFDGEESNAVVNNVMEAEKAVSIRTVILLAEEWLATTNDTLIQQVQLQQRKQVQINAVNNAVVERLSSEYKRVMKEIFSIAVNFNQGVRNQLDEIRRLEEAAKIAVADDIKSALIADILFDHWPFPILPEHIASL
uniref:Uncharacterized protein n=1 Tax=Panagrolaimus sp. ES5 TaxID=591445 RepID=A0AC34GJ10_9BILA